MSLIEALTAPVRRRALGRLPGVCHTYRVPNIPCSAMHGSLRDNLALVAQGTREEHVPRIMQFCYHVGPPAKKKGAYTLVLLKHDDTASGELAAEYCANHPRLLQPATAYHLFGAARHVGPLNQWLGHKHGPGIVASAPATPFGASHGPQVFTLWYAYPGAPCHGRVYTWSQEFPANALCAYLAA